MDTKQLKAYAPEARKKFIEAVTTKAAAYGLTAKKTSPVTETGDVVMIDGIAFPKAVAKQREQLVERIRRQGFDAFIESVAYTWFNRFVAIRYMEINGYLSHGYRVLSAANADKTVPEILENAARVELPGVDRNEVQKLQLDGTRDDELYRMLLIGQCNELNKAMPFLFESIKEGTELLLPDNLLHSDSLVRTLVNEIPEEQWKQVEVIGWLYQFYISERKDEVIGKVVASEDIPAATQLFTPNWIVKYLVQNTLGRQWMAVYPDSTLKNEMEYYIEPGEQEPEVVEQLKAMTPESLNPEELTFLDPACGSGHILVEAYALFKAIYLERGYRLRDIPELILSKNLFGLEIDDRAAQLASFALMMKAREDDRRIFDSERKDRPQPNVVCFTETGDLDAADLAKQVDLPKDDIATLLDLFKHAKTFGSLIRVPESVNVRLHLMRECLEMVKSNGDLLQRDAAESILPIIRQAELLARQYDFVVANPPYMGGKGMNPTLKTFLQNDYSQTKSDTFAAFMCRNIEIVNKNGSTGFVTPYVWMFISSFEDIRRIIFDTTTITSLIQLEYNAFEPACVPVCTFTLQKGESPRYKGGYIKLSGFRGYVNQAPKTLEAIKNPACGWFYRASADDFKKIPGGPVAYWVSERLYSAFESGKTIKNLSEIRVGLDTGDNISFINFWHEVSIMRIGFHAKTVEDFWKTCARWVPHTKGGPYRKWYGNLSEILAFSETDYNMLSNQGNRLPSRQFYFKPGFFYSRISSSNLSVRLSPAGTVFNSASPTFFPKNDCGATIFTLLNSKIIALILECLSPTLNFQAGELRKLPLPIINIEKHLTQQLESLISIAQTDWDSYETSWDFSENPLVRMANAEREGKEAAQ